MTYKTKQSDWPLIKTLHRVKTYVTHVTVIYSIRVNSNNSNMNSGRG